MTTDQRRKSCLLAGFERALSRSSWFQKALWLVISIVFHTPRGRGKSWIACYPALARAAFPARPGSESSHKAREQHASWCPIPERFPSAMTKGSCSQPPGRANRSRAGGGGWGVSGERLGSVFRSTKARPPCQPCKHRCKLCPCRGSDLNLMGPRELKRASIHYSRVHY